jgi:hypothetical protein
VQFVPRCCKRDKLGAARRQKSRMLVRHGRHPGSWSGGSWLVSWLEDCWGSVVMNRFCENMVAVVAVILGRQANGNIHSWKPLPSNAYGKLRRLYVY